MKKLNCVNTIEANKAASIGSHEGRRPKIGCLLSLFLVFDSGSPAVCCPGLIFNSFGSWHHP